MLQNCIQRNKLAMSYITKFGKFSWYWEQKVTMFGDVLLKKNVHAHLGYHTRKSQKT